jgi:SNF2 family DNA or RNA helicase
MNVTKESILKELKTIGKFSNLSSQNKSVLMNLLTAYKIDGSIPTVYLKKKLIGTKCKEMIECRTQNCIKNKCASKALTVPDVVLSSSCTTLTNGTKLNPHQKIVAEFMRDTKRKGLVVVHKVGTGKTITALVTSQCLLSQSPKSKVIVITPKAIVEQFSKELKKLNLHPNIAGRIHIFSHVTWLKRFESGIENAKNATLIVDEAHKFKGQNMMEQFGKEKSKLVRLLSEAAQEANKVLLLTATPLENGIEDTINYVSLTNDKDVSKEYKKMKPAFKSKQVIINDFRDYLKCNFSVYDQVQKEDFPRRIDHIVKLKMTKAYQAKYDDAEKYVEGSIVNKVFYNKKTMSTPDLTKFHNGIRRAVNGIETSSPKIIWTVDKIKEIVANKGKVVVYSTWIKFGIELIADKLKADNIKYQIISGDIRKSDRFAAVEAYNTKKLNVLLISSAGAEGLDLKETTAVIVVEPFWHQSRIEQVVGRGIRYKSHANLPQEKRFVDVYHLVLEKNNTLDGPSADELLMGMSNTKVDKIDQLMIQMKETSIENTTCT